MAGPVRIRLSHAGVLAPFGYDHVAAKTVAQRRAALRKAAKALGWLHLVRRLNVLYVYDKNRRPALAAKFRADREYASEMYAKAKATGRAAKATGRTAKAKAKAKVRAK